MSSEPSRTEFRCSTCNSAKENPRNLAVFIDGTANAPGPKKTNVFKLYGVVANRRDPQLEQHRLYLEGIGADDLSDLPSAKSTEKAVYNALDKASARNVEKNVKKAYSWLVDQYQQGGQIYLFGFSRGAYQVRALAAMIHEVGLLKKGEDRVEQAYRCYLSINLHDPKASESVVNFKKSFCEPGVRVHFIGVWDTVSSLGLIKQDVHVTASASVTNACHFRHALALDERRVKFMPEYFMEVNAHRSKIRRPKQAVCDVKEVWFAGCHGDVGGMSRPNTEMAPKISSEDVVNPVHAGNVPLVWMGREAAAEGLALESTGCSINPEDIDCGRVDSMKWYWGILEVVPVRYQVSFSGTGKHEWSVHGFRPRLVIPGQQIHLSVFPGSVYTTQARLACGVEIPMVPSELCTPEPADGEATISMLTSLLSDRQSTLNSLGDVLLLLNLRLEKNLTQVIPTPAWLREPKREPCDFDEAALTIIYDMISDSSTPQERERAMDSLSEVLRSVGILCHPRALYVLCFAAKNQRARSRFINDKVIEALMAALERSTKSSKEDVFPLVTECLCYLIDDEHHRTDIINRLFIHGTESGKARLLSALDATVPNHLVALLKMIAAIAQHQPDRCEVLRTGIISLATKGGPVGSAAVETLVKLENLEKGPYNIHLSNVLGYLTNTLPRLDVETGSAAPPKEISSLPPILKVNGSGGLDEKLMHRIVQTAASRDADQRTVATLTLLKLCNNSITLDFLKDKLLSLFLKQMKRKETSLLAAYALKTCLKLNMRKLDDFPRVPSLVVDMVEKCWFDDAVGRVEGAEIFRELMTSGELRQKVIGCHIVTKLEKKLAAGNHHEIRMSLIFLDILAEENHANLENTVTNNLTLLKDPDASNQRKAIKTLSSLAQTEAGEQVLLSHLTEIIKMLLPSDGGLAPSRQQLFTATSLLYDLCNNETLREKILKSREFARFMHLRQNTILYPKT